MEDLLVQIRQSDSMKRLTAWQVRLYEGNLERTTRRYLVY